MRQSIFSMIQGTLQTGLSLYMKCDHLSTCLLGTLPQCPSHRHSNEFPQQKLQIPRSSRNRWQRTTATDVCQGRAILSVGYCKPDAVHLYMAFAYAQNTDTIHVTWTGTHSPNDYHVIHSWHTDDMSMGTSPREPFNMFLNFLFWNHYCNCTVYLRDYLYKIIASLWILGSQLAFAFMDNIITRRHG